MKKGKSQIRVTNKPRKGAFIAAQALLGLNNKCKENSNAQMFVCNFAKQYWSGFPS